MMPDVVRWALLAAPSLFLVNWIFALLATAALVLRRRGQKHLRWTNVSRLAGSIALNPRTRIPTLLLALQLLVIDLFLPLAFVLLLRFVQR